MMYNRASAVMTMEWLSGSHQRAPHAIADTVKRFYKWHSHVNQLQTAANCDEQSLSWLSSHVSLAVIAIKIFWLSTGCLSTHVLPTDDAQLIQTGHGHASIQMYCMQCLCVHLCRPCVAGALSLYVQSQCICQLRCQCTVVLCAVF